MNPAKVGWAFLLASPRSYAGAVVYGAEGNSMTKRGRETSCLALLAIVVSGFESRTPQCFFPPVGGVV